MAEPSDEVADKVTVRLDPETKQMIQHVMKQSSMTVSQAMRVLITLGAAREGHLEHAFKASAYREATIQAVALLRKRVEKAIFHAIDDLEKLSL